MSGRSQAMNNAWSRPEAIVNLWTRLAGVRSFQRNGRSIGSSEPGGRELSRGPTTDDPAVRHRTLSRYPAVTPSQSLRPAQYRWAQGGRRQQVEHQASWLVWPQGLTRICSLGFFTTMRLSATTHT